MASTFTASRMWQKLNDELFADVDMATFRRSVNNRLSGLDVDVHGFRIFRTLLFTLAQECLDPAHLAVLDAIPQRQLGAPITVRAHGRDLCWDYIQSAWEVVFLADTLRDARSVVEIGAGFGRTCHAILATNPQIESYTIIDLPPCMALSRQFLQTVLEPDQFARIKFVANTEIDPDSPPICDLAINIDSMGEMDEEVARSYLSLIDGGARAFYTKNAVGKFRPETIGVMDANSESVRLALEAGMLRDVVDIFDTDALEAQAPRFIETYRPGPAWTLIANDWAKPWLYFHQALYRKG